MKVISLEDVPKAGVNFEGAKDVFKQVPLSAADGAPNFCFRVFTIEPGGHTPYHVHEFEHLNYFIEGSGFLVNETGQRTPVKKGDFSLVLANEKHQYRNGSQDQPMVMICAVPNAYE